MYLKLACRPSAAVRVADIAMIGGFLIAISLPLLGLLFSLDQGFVLEENRTLSSRPEFRLKKAALARFPARFEAYLQ